MNQGHLSRACNGCNQLECGNVTYEQPISLRFVEETLNDPARIVVEMHILDLPIEPPGFTGQLQSEGWWLEPRVVTFGGGVDGNGQAYDIEYNVTTSCLSAARSNEDGEVTVETALLQPQPDSLLFVWCDQGDTCAHPSVTEPVCSKTSLESHCEIARLHSNQNSAIVSGQTSLRTLVWSLLSLGLANGLSS
eukprot:g14798.t1